jgi:hypothetical protein
MTSEMLNTGARGEIVLYQTPGGKTALEVRLTGDTLWLTQAQIADLFEKERSVITKLLRNIFSQGELERPSVGAFFAHTAADGKTYQVEYFNLDAILSVGYRVNSRLGTQFRIRATNVLRDHLVPALVREKHAIRPVRVEGRVQVDQVDATAGDVLAQNRQIVAVGERVLGDRLGCHGRPPSSARSCRTSTG